MRCILRLCVVLAVGTSAWTSEMSSIAGEPQYQTPAATVTSSVTQATGTTAYPVTSPAGAYQTATSQPATTTMSPAPTMMSPGTYIVGTQPVATYATPMTNNTNNMYSNPVRIRGGFFGMSWGPGGGQGSELGDLSVAAGVPRCFEVAVG